MLRDFSAHKRRWLFAGVLAVVAASVACVLVWRELNGWLDQPMPVEAEVIVELPAGGNLTRFAAHLHRRGLLRHPRWLLVHARLTQAADRVQAGEYRLEPGITPRVLLDMLTAGNVIQYPVTLIEGSTVADILQVLGRQQPPLRASIADARAEALLTSLGIDPGRHTSAEGLFFPDTYSYRRGMSDADVLRMAHARMQQVLDEEWNKRSEGLPYKDAYQALIMASLIEKETGVGSERAQIAGVFVRRLKSGMLLQTDPTVIYGLGSAFDGNLTRSHLLSPSAYNTYLNAGLPPTPIALPGRAAIAAALHPQQGNELYFVARGDGTHEFSATLDDHNRAVQRLQVARRSNNYRSRPPQ
jgi:UPF0755 protein